MTNSVARKSCGTVLDDEIGGNPDEREPCPKCGSVARNSTLHAESGLYVITGGNVTMEVVPLKDIISSVSLLLQTIVVPHRKTAEGQLIEAVTLPWFDIIKLLENDPTIAYQIGSRKWEEIIAGAYKQAGFEEVTLTPRSGDYGRDVIAVKRGLGFVRIIDQVKAYSPGRLVVADDVRALMGVLQGDGASKGFLTTTSDFAPLLGKDPLIAPFMPSRLELINGEILLKRLIELREGSQTIS